MKFMNRSLIALGSTIAFAGFSQASVLFTDNFESYGPVGSDMNGQGGWSVVNGAAGVDGPVVIVDSYTWDTSVRSATVGGVVQPTVGTTSLTRAASLSMEYNNAFIIETAYTESTEGFRNNFQISLGSTAGTLLTIDLTPGGAGVYNVSYSGLIGSSPLGVLSANTSTQFRLDTSFDGTNVNYSLSNAGNSVAAGTLAVSQFTLINGLSVSWDATSGGGLGNNSLTIDNVTLVPEPSSALLGMLGASFALFRRRKA